MVPLCPYVPARSSRSGTELSGRNIRRMNRTALLQLLMMPLWGDIMSYQTVPEDWDRDPWTPTAQKQVTLWKPTADPKSRRTGINCADETEQKRDNLIVVNALFLWSWEGEGPFISSLFYPFFLEFSRLILCKLQENIHWMVSCSKPLFRTQGKYFMRNISYKLMNWQGNLRMMSL